MDADQGTLAGRSFDASREEQKANAIASLTNNRL